MCRSLNSITCSALILKENLGLLFLDFADMRDHEEMFSSMESSGDPRFFLSPKISAPSSGLGCDECLETCCGLYENSDGKMEVEREYFLFHIQINKLVLH